MTIQIVNLNGFELLFHRSLYDPVTLSQVHDKTAPKEFPEGLVASDQWIYECDPDLVNVKDNPHGVGKHFGQVKDPFGDSLKVNFWNAKKRKWVPETLLKVYARAAPPVGTQFTMQSVIHTIGQYTHEGCHVNETPVPSPKKKRQTARSRKKKCKTMHWNYVDPSTGDTIPTSVQVPGLAWCTIFNEPVWIESMARGRGSKAYVIVQGKGTAAERRKGKHHLRKCTDAEFDKANEQAKAKAKRAKAKPQAKAKPAKAKPQAKAKPVKAKEQAKAKPAKAKPEAESSPEAGPCNRWLRCRAPALDSKELEALTDALEGVGCDDFSECVYYIFAMRVAQEYKLRQRSACHFNKTNILGAAVSQVFVQVRPKNVLPHDGQLQDAVDTLLPVLEQVFNMPSIEGDKNADRKWVQRLIDSDEYTYDDCYDYDALMQYHVKRECAAGRKHDGFPILDAGEVVPDGDNHYQATSTPKYNNSSTQPHKHLPFVRMTSVNAALKDMKNMGVFFVAIKGEDMSNGVPWNNFGVAGNTFCALYCRREGILRTQKLARKIQLFVFYGYYTWVTKQRKTKKVITKQKPVIFYLAKSLINGRSRLANGVGKNFASFLTLIDNDPSVAEFLEDKGEGEPPMEYLIAVEHGLRGYADDIHAMGTQPLRSAYHWGHKVPVWRKREAYIALCRHVEGKSPVYKQWDCFLFEDYAQRQRAQKTFMKRHLPLSSGDDEHNFDGAYDFDWSSKEYSPKRKRVKVEKITPRRRFRPAREATTGVMVFDVEKGCMVPM